MGRAGSGEGKGKANGIRRWYQTWWAKVAGILILLALISTAYFLPAAWEGRVLYQMDGAAAAGTGRDVVHHKEATGERSYWTGSLFGGMPTYQISPSYPSSQALQIAQRVYRLEAPFDLLPGDSYLLFMMLLGFYIFMRSLGAKRLLSLGGALFWAFSSYFLILIQAGHLWKLLTLAYIPPTLAGLVLAFHRRKYLWGLGVTALFTALQVYSNHIQMSYYFAFVMLAMVIAWGIEAVQKQDIAHFLKALGVVALGGVLGVLVNSTSLYHTYQYSKETMRGGREITVLDKEGSTTSSAQGLDKAYITQWSYGIDEMLTFLIPDAKGGASGQIGFTEKAISKAGTPEAQHFVAQQNRYWGDQPFTAGPVYVGAFVLALALFGMMVARGPMKWALLVVTLLTIMLSWGHNFMGLTSFFIDYIPLYNKFRTPSSILVVAEFTIPLFALWALYLILKHPTILVEKRWASITALLLTLGVALLFALAPSSAGSFLSKPERDAFGEYLLQAPELGFLVAALEQVRSAIFQADAWRSVVVILLGSLLIYLFYRQKLSAKWMLTLVITLSFLDLWLVDKRYLNDDMYHHAAKIQQKVEEKTEIDKLLLEDPAEYRVMNLTVNTFNDATTSYHHRSIGGYHAAKLQRYQDLIEGYLSKMDLNVLRALNTKYYIVADSTGTPRIQQDDLAYGDGWFVKQVKRVSTPDEEFLALGTTPLHEVAILAPPFAAEVPTELPQDSTATLQLTHYSPNELRYNVESKAGGLVVLSEVYYPHGWHATVSGIPTPILRADYLLRALQVPAGKHEVVLRFEPTSIKVTEAIAYTATALIFLLLLGGVGLEIRRRKQQRHATSTPQ